jgi:heptaprenyl diphosphate synthase
MPASIERTRLKILADFGALCLFFAAIEYIFSRALPFFRIGLSNIPILLALDFMPFQALLALVAVKVLGQALLNGTLSSYVFLFSLSGSLASFLVMYPLSKILKRRVSLIGIGSAGALASNIVQVLLSVVFIFGQASIVMAPFLLGVGAVTGVLMGGFAQAFRDRSKWLLRVEAAWRNEL